MKKKKIRLGKRKIRRGGEEKKKKENKKRRREEEEEKQKKRRSRRREKIRRGGEEKQKKRRGEVVEEEEKQKQKKKQKKRRNRRRGKRKFTADREKDLLTLVLGNDEHGGRTRGFGPSYPWWLGFARDQDTYRSRERAKKRQQDEEKDDRGECPTGVLRPPRRNPYRL